jgi:hypothetical protein
MNDNFDLRKFLVESKSIENMNPIFRKLNENTEKNPGRINEYGLDSHDVDEQKSIKNAARIIGSILGREAAEKYARLINTIGFNESYRYGFGPEEMEQISNNPNYNRGDIIFLKTLMNMSDIEHSNGLNENNLRAKIREMVLNELGGGENESEMMDEDELYEAKKDEEELPADDAELDPDMAMDAEMDAPEDELTAAASGATGDAKELINHLMTSLDTAKAMGNEKLTTQILNTLKFAIDQSMAQ